MATTVGYRWRLRSGVLQWWLLMENGGPVILGFNLIMSLHITYTVLKKQRLLSC